VSLYQFKSQWDVQKRKEKKPNENLSEAQREAAEARRREHYPYLTAFLNGREVIRRTDSVIPVLIGRKIPNPLRNFEAYSMHIMTLLKPWRIPLPDEKEPYAELKPPDKTWSEAFKQWRGELDSEDVAVEQEDQKTRILLMRKQARDFIKHWASLFEGAEIAKAETAARKAAGKGSATRSRGLLIYGMDSFGLDDEYGMLDPDEDEQGSLSVRTTV